MNFEHGIIGLLLFVNVGTACYINCITCKDQDVDVALLSNGVHSTRPCFSGTPDSLTTEMCMQTCTTEVSFVLNENFKQDMTSVKAQTMKVTRRCISEQSDKKYVNFECKSTKVEDKMAREYRCYTICSHNYCNQDDAAILKKDLIVPTCRQCTELPKKNDKDAYSCTRGGAGNKIPLGFCVGVCYIRILFNYENVVQFKRGCMKGNHEHLKKISTDKQIAKLNYIGHTGYTSIAVQFCIPSAGIICNENWGLQSNTPPGEYIKQAIIESHEIKRRRCVYCISERDSSSVEDTCETGNGLSINHNFVLCDDNCFTYTQVKGDTITTIKGCEKPHQSKELLGSSVANKLLELKQLNEPIRETAKCTNNVCFRYCSVNTQLMYCNQFEGHRTLKEAAGEAVDDVINDVLTLKEIRSNSFDISSNEIVTKLNKIDENEDNIISNDNLEFGKFSRGTKMGIYSMLSMMLYVFGSMLFGTAVFKAYRKNKKKPEKELESQADSSAIY